MEYGDFIRFDWDDPNYKVDFLQYLKWILDNDYSPIKQHLINEFNLHTIPNRNDDDIISGAIANTQNDLQKKENNENYYMCNIACVLKMITKIYTKDLYNNLSFMSTNNSQLFDCYSYRYKAILFNFLSDIEYLSTIFKKRFSIENRYPCSKSNYLNCLPLHQVLRQSLYGSISFDSFCDVEISPSIGIIRQLIELRMRRAFGVMAYQNQSGNVIPLDFSKLMSAIKNHSKDISFPVKIENINRIYTWSNMYIHSGKTDYSWLSFFIEDYLKVLSMGKKENKGWSVNNGIKTTVSVIEDIRKELLDLVNEPTIIKFLCFKIKRKPVQSLTLLICDPECELQ